MWQVQSEIWWPREYDKAFEKWSCEAYEKISGDLQREEIILFSW